jgi:acetyl-CoA acyltransferase
MKDVVIIGGVRTPVGKYGGTLKTVSDGAAMVVLTTPEKAAELGVAPFARFKSCVVAGAAPKI